MFDKPEMFYLFILLPFFILLMILFLKKDIKNIKKIAGDDYKRIFPFYSSTQKSLKILFYTLGLVFVIISLARPQWGIEKLETPLEGRDILFLVDVSFSMSTSDIPPSRIDVAKVYIDELLKSDSSDRVGLMAFSGESRLLVPVTHDYNAVSFFVNSLFPGMVGKGDTDIGKALVSAVDQFDDTDMNSKVIFLMTDGEDLGRDFNRYFSKVEESNAIIYTVGIGTARGEPIPILDTNGNVQSYVKDENGKLVMSRLDEEFLKNIAEKTGGSYMIARGKRGEMKHFIDSITNVQKKDYKQLSMKHKKDQYPLFLFIALFFLSLGFILDQTRIISLFHKFTGSRFIFILVFFIFNLDYLIAQDNDSKTDKNINKNVSGDFFKNSAYFAGKHFDNGDYTKALENYQKAMSYVEDDELSALFYNIGNIYHKIEDYKNSSTYFENALSLKSDDSLKKDILYNYGLTQFKQQDFAKAENLFKEVLLISPSDDDARYMFEVSRLLKQQSEDENQDQNEQSKDKNEQQDQKQNQSEQNQQQNSEESLSEDQIQQLLDALDDKEKNKSKEEANQRQRNMGNGGQNW